jgi:hypothetical protein
VVVYVDLPAVTIEGELYRRVVRCEETYTSAAGPVRVMRSLYRRLGEGERTLCPLELRAGIVEGRWTPLAARQATFVVAHLTPQEGEVELTPFRGHFIFWEGGVHDVETKKCISAGVPATDGRVGPVGPQPGRAVAGV